MSARSAVALAIAGAVLVGGPGCSPPRAVRPEPTVPRSAEATPAMLYSTDASLVPPPDAPRDVQLTHARALVRRYVWRAQAGEREAMLSMYLPETRRSAETVVARDLELASKGGPLAGGIGVYSSVSREGAGLQPASGASRVGVEDAARLDDLLKVHDDASIVLLEFTDGTARPVFVVRDGPDWWVLP